MKAKVQERLSCLKCGKNMAIENTSKARYTVFVLWKCECGFQHLEKRHMPVVNSV
jgi:hypothetical protein